MRHPVRRILVPVDLSPLSRLAYRWAREHFPKAEVEVLFVCERPVPLIMEYPSPPIFPANLRRVEKRLRKDFPGAKARAMEGGPASVITRRARGFDLVIMGGHGRRGLKRAFLGSVSELVARRSATPVLIVKS
ncbi:MAG: universal stress protein [Elusimicrobiota bacterium]|nr:universal stress protein [Elusimicrobiota bacterium]